MTEQKNKIDWKVGDIVIHDCDAKKETITNALERVKEENKMTEQKFEPRQPDYKGDGVAVWVALDKENRKYLNIKVLNSISLKAFKNNSKEKKEEL